MGLDSLKFQSSPQSLPLRSLNHISRVSRDVRKSVEFYCNTLGFVEIKRPQAFEFEGSWLFNYGIGIHLIQGNPVPRPSSIDPKGDHLSFQSDCLHEVEGRLKRLGLPYVTNCVEEGGIRVKQIFFHDPDHNMIEICNCDCLPITPLERSYCMAQLQRQSSLPMRADSISATATQRSEQLTTSVATLTSC